MMKSLLKAYSKILLQTIIRIMIIKNLEIFAWIMTYQALRVNIHIKNFLDWLNEIERFFEYMEIPGEKKKGLVAYKLTEGTLVGN